MKTIKRMIVSVLLVCLLIMPTSNAFAAQNNNQTIIQTLAQQIVAQQVAVFQAQGQVLTPEQIALLQQNATAIATQQVQILQAQQTAALQAQQATMIQSVPKPNGTENIVYIAPSGEGTKYHRQYCRTLRNGASPITLDQAKSMGRTSCKVCY